ncbi:hypothetical protein LTR53_020299, partial [Teratosphaeriaceae sp. CCFEE 6253]
MLGSSQNLKPSAKKTPEKRSPELQADEHAPLIDAMAAILAYYDLSSAQLVDTITKVLQRGLMYEMDAKLIEALHAALDVYNDEYCA